MINLNVVLDFSVSMFLGDSCVRCKNLEVTHPQIVHFCSIWKLHTTKSAINRQMC